MPESLKRLWFAFEDRLFDWRYNIDTRGVAKPRGAGGEHAEASAHATSYQAVWTRNLRVLIRRARQEGNQRVFVDIGSGKGKACIYASRHFARVVGVEYSGELLEAARANQERARRPNIEFVQADAALYDLPEEEAVIFLFNPFDEVMLGRFLARNRARIKGHRSLVAYANDVQRETLAQHGFECLYRDAVRNISLWR